METYRGNKIDGRAEEVTVEKALKLVPLRKRKEGGTLVLVIMIISVLALGLGTYMQSLSNYRQLCQKRLYDDQALMAAEAGFALESGTLAQMASPLTSDTTVTFSLPTAQFAPFQNVTVAVHVQTLNALAYWTITSTAMPDTSKMHGTPFFRRVQATISQEDFAKFELFVNNFGGVWGSGYLAFLGCGTVYMGPMNFNSGIAFFPDFWALSQVTCAATGGVNMYSDYNSYSNAVYGNNAANNDVSILQYWSSTYATAPDFAGGLKTIPSPINLPTSISSDTRSSSLVANAGLTLPDAYVGYNAAAGPNFAVTLVNNGILGNGQINIQQYLGTKNGVPLFGPTQITSVSAVHGAMVVKGNIVSLQGTLNGRLTIGALATSSDPSGGNVNITGNLQYQSRLNYSNFQYPDPNQLINANGQPNTSYINSLQSQLNSITDILGIVSEGNVTIKQYDLNGNQIAANPNNPLYVDAVVMATGVSTSTPGGGGFAVENYTSRPVGQVNFLGGMIQNLYYNWAVANSNGLTSGVNQVEFWDKRAAQGGGAPPFFPTTGNYELLPNSWSTSYVASASAPASYPSIH